MIIDSGHRFIPVEVGGNAGLPHNRPSGGIGAVSTDAFGTEHLQPISIAELTGAVSSRHTRVQTYRPKPVITPTTIKDTVKGIDLKIVQEALQDQRIPNGTLQLNGTTVTVDGLKLTVAEAAQGLEVTASAVNLKAETVTQAIAKLSGLVAVKRTLSLIDNNKNVMVTPTVELQANGSYKIRTRATVHVNPKARSQANGVLQQLDGGLTMPEAKKRPIPQRNRRTVVMA